MQKPACRGWPLGREEEYNHERGSYNRGCQWEGQEITIMSASKPHGVSFAAQPCHIRDELLVFFGGNQQTPRRAENDFPSWRPVRTGSVWRFQVLAPRRALNIIPSGGPAVPPLNGLQHPVGQQCQRIPGGRWMRVVGRIW